MSTTANDPPAATPASSSNPPVEGQGSSVSDDTSTGTQVQSPTVTTDNGKFFTDLSNRLDAMPETVLNALAEKFPHLTTPPKVEAAPKEAPKETTEAPPKKETHAEPGQQGRTRRTFGQRWFGV